MKAKKVDLPYVNNLVSILITLAINLVMGLLFSRLVGASYSHILWETLVCVFTTTLIDVWIVYGRLKKLRAAGQMPAHVPISRVMQRLPQNPVALGAIFVVVFGVVMVAINALVLWFFGLTSMTLVPWMTYKLLYSTILSAKITEYVIFRYVQPDWATAGSETTGPQPPVEATSVKNPMPRVSVFKEMYGAVTGNIAMNIIIGTALGGVVVDAASDVVIYPTTLQGIRITGLVFGLIVGILVTNGIVKATNEGILAAPARGGILPLPDRRFTWMPKHRFPLTILVCACMMLFSSFALWVIMKLFGISIMNFYQFTVFITIYAATVSKPLSSILVRRCMQPDYILYVLGKKDK